MHVSPLRSITYLWQGQGHWIRLWETVRSLSSPRSNCSWFRNLWKSAPAFSPSRPPGEGAVRNNFPEIHLTQTCVTSLILREPEAAGARARGGADIQVRRPCGSQVPGSGVRLMTSTEHPGGEGLKLHAIQPPILSLVVINRQEDCCVACAHSLWECEHGTWKNKGIWPEPATLIIDLVLKAKVAGLIRCGARGLIVLHFGCQSDTLKTTYLARHVYNFFDNRIYLHMFNSLIIP